MDKREREREKEREREREKKIVISGVWENGNRKKWRKSNERENEYMFIRLTYTFKSL